ncbi:uncharacterized protein CLUP02_07652 [Colletotrichum lupini]|uniref:Uncharacterized protein n=1 Tax=Colletotrichum lupini TaxID=145971 RepID=A0A9Q8SST1_9PEZI|nr:uncharacterized protein CLUP02_07652 [Colletotrichum lupini]UQC82166.1 hypothetical protein CLUP02_07652 [Colletotrichum lupini]
MYSHLKEPTFFCRKKEEEYINLEKYEIALTLHVAFASAASLQGGLAVTNEILLPFVGELLSLQKAAFKTPRGCGGFFKANTGITTKQMTAENLPSQEAFSSQTTKLEKAPTLYISRTGAAWSCSVERISFRPRIATSYQIN